VAKICWNNIIYHSNDSVPKSSDFYISWMKIWISKKNPVFIKISIRYLKTSNLKSHYKNCDQLQSPVILNFTSITCFWYWVLFNWFLKISFKFQFLCLSYILIGFSNKRTELVCKNSFYWILITVWSITLVVSLEKNWIQSLLLRKNDTGHIHAWACSLNLYWYIIENGNWLVNTEDLFHLENLPKPPKLEPSMYISLNLTISRNKVIFV
jgi:hypothetical protein